MALHAIPQPGGVEARLGFSDPLINLFLGDVLPLNLPLHALNRIPHLREWEVRPAS